MNIHHLELFYYVARHKGIAGAVRITVRDSGPGASEDVLARLFEKGFTRRPAAATDRSGGGHFGLGMWIVSRNVAALNGTVGARNAEPSGLKVTIDLPVAETD